jgi:hypothetical protein
LGSRTLRKSTLLEDEQSGGIPFSVALDLAAGRVRRSLRVTHGTQRRAIQKRAVI